MNPVRRIIFWISLTGLAVFLTAFTIGQFIPIEFRDSTHRGHFYNSGFYVIPVSILLTLTGTIRKADTGARKKAIAVFTIFASGLSVSFLFATIFTIGFGAWTDLNVKFRNKENKNIRVVEQLYDVGALGYGGKRIVKKTPVTPLFDFVVSVDTTQINKADWDLVNQEGDIKY